MKKILFSCLLVFAVSHAYSQYFIPIFIPYTVQTYMCKSENPVALEYYLDAKTFYTEEIS